MTPETKRTFRKAGGVLMLMFWTVAMVFVLTPQLEGNTFGCVLAAICLGIGLFCILVIGLKLTVAANNPKRRP